MAKNRQANLMTLDLGQLDKEGNQDVALAYFLQSMNIQDKTISQHPWEEVKDRSFSHNNTALQVTTSISSPYIITPTNFIKMIIPL